jgi:hypothetical protein
MAKKARPHHPDPPSPKSEFAEAREGKQLSLSQEFWLFILENKKWWLIPILLVLGLVGLLVVFGSTGAAPFIYTLI